MLWAQVATNRQVIARVDHPLMPMYMCHPLMPKALP